MVLGRVALCGCMQVCNTTLEPSWPQYERMIGGLRFACAARPQYAKMWFLLHKAASDWQFWDLVSKEATILRVVYENHCGVCATWPCVGQRTHFERLKLLKIDWICIRLCYKKFAIFVDFVSTNVTLNKKCIGSLLWAVHRRKGTRQGLDIHNNELSIT